MKEIQLSVNELMDILSKYLKFKSGAVIKSVDVANINNQHHPENKLIGIGGVLTIYLEKL